MIESIIYRHLKQERRLSEKLVKYNKEPAVFNMEFPADSESGWEGKDQYPRLLFELTRQDDPERKTAGFLSVDVYLTKRCGIYPEDIEPLVRDAIDGYFFTDETETISASYKQSDPFTSIQPDSEVYGVTVTFDILAFPQQHLQGLETWEIDPVKAVDDYIKAMLPDARIIGVDNLDSAWKSKDETPAIYTRLQRILPGPPGTYHVTWFNPVMVVHVMAPSFHVKKLIIKRITEKLQQETRIILPDKSPMRITRMVITTGADDLKEGQLSIEAIYGVLRRYPDVEPINPAFTTKEA